MLRCIGSTLFAVAIALALPALGVVVGWYVGILLVGMPEDPHCGLAAMPAMLTGGIFAFVGAVVGVIGGMNFFFEVLDQQSYDFGGEDNSPT